LKEPQRAALHETSENYNWVGGTEKRTLEGNCPKGIQQTMKNYEPFIQEESTKTQNCKSVGFE
jgi:hypothetical protein